VESKAAKKPVKTVDDYFAAAPPDKRAVVQRVRAVIKAAAPKSTEEISYGMAGFRHHNGKPLVYLAYWKTHCALYGTGHRFIKEHAAELKPFEQSKGTIKFRADKPLPDALLRKIVKSRIAEVEKAG
jgi:uncharacterized protein YdhG (YjbR/CyaY superfamily)